MMILAHVDPAAVRAPRATVYTVLADTARSRSTRWLATEGGVAAALAGTAVRLFWGDAPGPYGACYRADCRPSPCKADRGLPTVGRLPL